ncbi:hypothetical protein L7F22_017196 [Adiantum nelumboides]|nr:hypothetical protein [Adiantum nelumboides]
MDDRWSLKGRTALVTGATKGIGRAIAEELAQLGASVYVCARSEIDLKERLQEWKAAGLAISGCACDVSSYPSCEQLMAHVSAHFQGNLDILVLNAATMGSQATGHNVCMYHCTKGAVNQLTKNLAFEWAEDGIRVNAAVAPGYIFTELACSLGDDVINTVGNRTPLRRYGEVHEIAAAVAFLCMPCSAFTTGIIMTIDGGMTCHHSLTACPSIETS